MNVVFSPAAERDLSSLVVYIRDDLQNTIAAHNLAEKILHLSYKLKNYPEMGASLEAIDTRISGYRHLLADNYIIIYKVTGQEVCVICILYARSDYLRLLRG